MSLDNFLLMRNEMSLLAVILLILIGELFVDNKKTIAKFALAIFVLHTLVGFFPIKTGELFGGSFRTNELVFFFKSVLNVGVIIVLLQSADWAKNILAVENKAAEFYILLFSTLLGMYYMISAGDFLMLFIGIELATIPTAALIAYETGKLKSAEAGIKFILSAAVATSVSLFGISMLYAATGSIYFNEMVANIAHSDLAILGFIFFFAGIAFKISLVPFHFWTADTYEGAPISIASYLSVISKASAVFVLLMLLFTVFKSLEEIWKPLIYGIAVATMFIGNLFALRQQNMKRFLAFSSIAQAGFILLGMLASSKMGITTVIYFSAIYIFSNLAAFGVVQSISLKTGKENMNDYEGLYRTNPKLSLVMLLALFSLAGIPPVAGFFGKFFLFTAAASKGYYLLVFIATVNVTISLYYYLLVVRAMFLRKSAQAIPFYDNSILTKIGLVISVLGIVIIGLYSPIYEYVSEISNFIF